MSGLMSLLGGAGAIAAGYDLSGDIRDTGADAANQMGQLASQLQNDVQFQGYGVQSNLGNTTVDQQGNVNLGVGPNTNLSGLGEGQMGWAANNYAQANNLALSNAGNPAFQQALGMYNQGAGALAGQQGSAFNASQQAMGNAMMDTAGREQQIYDRAMAMQQPALDAQRAQQQATEFARGRGGVRGSQFGGTAEDAAMARAQAQASNQASFQAMDQAQQEMMNQGQLASQFGQLGQGAAGLQNQFAQGVGNLGYQQAQLGQGSANVLNATGQGAGNLGMNAYQLSFLPMEQQMQLLQYGGQNADRFQSGQFTGANLGAQLGLGGIQAQVNAEQAASQLYGNLAGAGLNAIGSTNASGLWDEITSIF